VQYAECADHVTKLFTQLLRGERVWYITYTRLVSNLFPKGDSNEDLTRVFLGA